MHFSLLKTTVIGMTVNREAEPGGTVAQPKEPYWFVGITGEKSRTSHLFLFSGSGETVCNHYADGKMRIMRRIYLL